MAITDELDPEALKKEKERLTAARSAAQEKLTAMDKDTQAIRKEFDAYGKMQKDLDGDVKELLKNKLSVD